MLWRQIRNFPINTKKNEKKSVEQHLKTTLEGKIKGK